MSHCGRGHCISKVNQYFARMGDPHFPFPSEEPLVGPDTVTLLHTFNEHILFTRKYFDLLKNSLNTPSKVILPAHRPASSKYVYIRLALGNESCDLDSFASSLVVSYLFYLRGVGPVINRLGKGKNSETETKDSSEHTFWKTRKIKYTLRSKSDWIILPIIFTTRPLFMLRGDCVKACEIFGVEINDLIFIDDLIDFLKQFLGQCSDESMHFAKDIFRRSSSVVATFKPKLASDSSSMESLGQISSPGQTSPANAWLGKIIILDLILVDQPNIPLYLKQFLLKESSLIRFKVSCIYDHHAEDPSVKPFLERRSRLIKCVETVSSNMTILTLEYQKLFCTDQYIGLKLAPYFTKKNSQCGKFMTNFFGMMLATILIDSNNLDLSSERVTKKDIDMVSWISSKIECLDLFNALSPFLGDVQAAHFPANSTTLLFQLIIGTKIASNTATDLTSDLALEKDLKLYEISKNHCNSVYGISSIGTSIQDWLQKAKFGVSQNVFEHSEIISTEEENYNIASILISHLEKYSLEFLFIITAYQDTSSLGNLAKLERQLCLFAPLKSSILASLRHSNSNSTFESELTSSQSSLFEASFILKPITSTSSVDADLTPSMILYGIFGQEMTDILKLVNNESVMPNFLLCWDPSKPVESTVRKTDHQHKEYYVFTSFSQLDTTYSRKKVHPLLHKRLSFLLPPLSKR